LLYETAVHFLIPFAFGRDLETIFCQTNRINPAIQGEDYPGAGLLSSGAKGMIDANRISGASPPEVAFGEFRIEGEHAMIRIAADGNLFLTDYGKPEVLLPVKTHAEGYKGDSVKALQEHFAGCLLSGQSSESEGADYLKTVMAVDACYRSAQTGMPVKIA
jgi:predicted dehydrogenase